MWETSPRPKTKGNVHVQQKHVLFYINIKHIYIRKETVLDLDESEKSRNGQMDKKSEGRFSELGRQGLGL